MRFNFRVFHNLPFDPLVMVKMRQMLIGVAVVFSLADLTAPYDFAHVKNVEKFIKAMPKVNSSNHRL